MVAYTKPHRLVYSDYIQVPNLAFFRVLLPHLGWLVQSKAICLIKNPDLTKSLQPPSHHRLVGDLGNHSSSSEACQDHQKLN